VQPVAATTAANVAETIWHLKTKSDFSRDEPLPLHFIPQSCYSSLNTSGIAYRFGGRVDAGVWGTEVPQRVSGAEPRWGSGAMPKEARYIHTQSAADKRFFSSSIEH